MHSLVAIPQPASFSVEAHVGAEGGEGTVVVGVGGSVGAVYKDRTQRYALAGKCILSCPGPRVSFSHTFSPTVCM